MEKSMIATLLETQLVERRKTKVDFIYSQIQAAKLLRYSSSNRIVGCHSIAHGDCGSIGAGIITLGEPIPTFKM